MLVVAKVIQQLVQFLLNLRCHFLAVQSLQHLDQLGASSVFENVTPRCQQALAFVALPKDLGESSHVARHMLKINDLLRPREVDVDEILKTIAAIG